MDTTIRRASEMQRLRRASLAWAREQVTVEGSEWRQRDTPPVRGGLGLPRPEFQSQRLNPRPHQTDMGGVGARRAWGPVLCILLCGPGWFRGGAWLCSPWVSGLPGVQRHILSRSHSETQPGHICHRECPGGLRVRAQDEPGHTGDARAQAAPALDRARQGLRAHRACCEGNPQRDCFRSLLEGTSWEGPWRPASPQPTSCPVAAAVGFEAQPSAGLRALSPCRSQSPAFCESISHRCSFHKSSSRG